MNNKNLKDEKEHKPSNENIIFDETEIYKEKIFQMFEHKGIFYYGIFLPKWEEQSFENKNKETEIKRVQVWKPYLISSNNNIREYGYWIKDEMNININEIPQPNNKLRWDLKSIEAFKDKQDNNFNLKSTFEKIKKVYEKYIYFNNHEMYSIQTLWDIGTYFFMLFDYYPLMENRGLKGSGKTKQMTIGRQITFNATEEMTNPSASTLFRDTNNFRPTKYIDEAEKLYFYNIKTGRYESDERAELINSGFKRTGSISRQEKKGNKFFTITYSTYSPTFICSINGLFGATEDRAIINIMTKPPHDDNRGSLEPLDNDILFKEIRNSLYLIGLKYGSLIKKEYENLNITELKNRNINIWKPLLVIAKYIDEKVYSEVLNYAIKQQDIKDIEGIDEGSIEFNIIKCVYLMFKTNSIAKEQEKIYITTIVNYYETIIGSKLAPKTIGVHMDKFGFRQQKATSNGTYYRLSEGFFSNNISSVFASFPSFSSMWFSELEDKKSIWCLSILEEKEEKLEGKEENKINGLKKLEEKEATEEKEGHIERRGNIERFDNRCIVWSKCSFEDCFENECNKYADGKIYCKNHFLEVQKNVK